MCGIVGVVAKGGNGLLKMQEDSFFQMLYADALRGEDSTGVIGVERNGTFHIAKEAFAAEWFIYQLKQNHKKEIIDPMWQKGKAFIGHNRKKTSGKISDETAHPFVVNDRFAMVHNGTLLDHSKLAKTEVDSQALAIHLATIFEKGGPDWKGLKPVLEDKMGEVNGAYAVACYDQEHNNVYLLRNIQRPLSVIETDNAWYFMSEPLMGAWILQRNQYKYESLKATHILEHELVTFDLDKGTMNKEMFSPKKSWGYQTQTSPVIGYPPGSAMGKTSATTTAVKERRFCVTEKDLKKFRHDWLGKRVSFWVDEYLECNFPRTHALNGETEFTIMGEHEEIGWSHTIAADVNLDALGMHWPDDLMENKWTGVIEAVSTTNSGRLQIQLAGGVKPIVSSIPKKKALAPASDKERAVWKAHMETKSTEELDAAYELNKYNSWETWQITAVNQILAFRTGMRSLEHAVEVAKKDGGIILKTKHIDGMILYIDDMGKIYYETPIAVH